MTGDGALFDFERIFDAVPAMREAGVTECAAGVTGRLEGVFGSTAAIERYIGDLANFAATA